MLKSRRKLSNQQAAKGGGGALAERDDFIDCLVLREDCREWPTVNTKEVINFANRGEWTYVVQKTHNRRDGIITAVVAASGLSSICVVALKKSVWTVGAASRPARHPIAIRQEGLENPQLCYC